MTVPRTDVLGIGNAIVDVIARAGDEFLATQQMRKGGMALIDEVRAASLYDVMGPAVEVSGGSAANTIVGVASFAAGRNIKHSLFDIAGVFTFAGVFIAAAVEPEQMVGLMESVRAEK